MWNKTPQLFSYRMASQFVMCYHFRIVSMIFTSRPVYFEFGSSG